jgi:hypothetical protein
VLQKKAAHYKIQSGSSTQLFRAGENPSKKKKSSKLVLNSIFLEWLRTKVLSELFFTPH